MTEIYDLLEDKLIAARISKDESIAIKQELLKQCEQLIARNERIKKNLTDDMTACRYNEPSTALSPMQIVGLLTGLPLSAVAIVKLLLSDKPETQIEGAAVGAVLGAYISFHGQAKKLCRSSAKNICENGRQIKNSFMLYYLKESTRQNIFAGAFFFRFQANVITAKEPGACNPVYPKTSNVLSIPQMR